MWLVAEVESPEEQVHVFSPVDLVSPLIPSCIKTNNFLKILVLFKKLRKVNVELVLTLRSCVLFVLGVCLVQFGAGQSKTAVSCSSLHLRQGRNGWSGQYHRFL